MYLKTIRIKNYRRLNNVRIDFDNDLSIFVGANNSGKTSVAHAMYFFLSGKRERVDFHDISACRWADIVAFEDNESGVTLPELSIDLWFNIEESDLHRVIDLLPNLDWQGTKVGIRISFAPINQKETLNNFKKRRAQALQSVRENQSSDDKPSYTPPPRTFKEFLETEIHKEYEFKYFVLDEAQFNDNLEQRLGYEPQELLRDQGRTGRDIVNSIIKVDFVHAQRHLSDSAGGNRAEELSRHLSRFYNRNLERHSEDHNAIRALAESESLLNSHLEHVFSDTFKSLSQLGYPGLTNPRLVIKSALNPVTVMNNQDGAQVYYALDDEGLTLPDKYNGLGFKNLIYMVIELLDLHAQWLSVEENRPPLHLVFIEEPEAHLHAQLQQVFVNKVLDILATETEGGLGFRTQLVLTTHSPHILFERGFRSIRYFRRESSGVNQSSQVLNLSEFYRVSKIPSSDFLERYLKLTHCDLFFADAAILVEGNVERLLMPQMIEKEAPGLRSSYLSILEIGGAFGHLFRTLIEFLRITTLVITDLDSVVTQDSVDKNDNIEANELVNNNEDEEDESGAAKSTCTPETPDAETSNQMLRRWLPVKNRIDELLALGTEDKTSLVDEIGNAAVRVTYPGNVDLRWEGKQLTRAGRTLEVAFAFDNLEWTQDKKNKDLKLFIRAPQSLEDLAERLHNKVHSSNFKKTDFALALLAKRLMFHIVDGLKWLEKKLGVAERGKNLLEGGQI